MFPSFKAWLSAIRLTISALICGSIAGPTAFWFFIVSVSFLSPTPDVAPVMLALGVLALIVGLIWHLFLGLLWWLILKALWHHPPQWLRAGGLRAGLCSYGMMFVAAMPLTALVMLSAVLNALAGNTPRRVSLETSAGLMLLCWWMFPTMIAYFYHWFPGLSSAKAPAILSKSR